MIIDSGLGSYSPDIDKEICNRISDNVIDARKYIKKNDNTFYLNEKYADVYINALKNAKIKNKKLINETIKDSVLICTQPLIEDGIIDDERDVMLYEKIIKLAKSKNLKVCIKLHPREKIDKYIGLKAEFLRSNNTLEEILANCEKPRCIISPFSTVMMDARFFYDIPSYGVYKMLNIKGYDYIKEDYAELSAFPTSIEDIHEL